MKKIILLLSFIVTAFAAKSQCNANFVLTQNTGGNVTFTSTSTGTVPSTYYQWSWGDATNSNGSALTNMSHTYPTNGNYTISLTITNYSTCTSTYTQAISVTSSPCTLALNASFTSTAGAGGNVNFTSTSTGTTASTTYSWNFGDGNGSNLMNPSNTYTSNGFFSVFLLVTDGMCTDSVQSTVAVSSAPCTLVPSFTSTNTSSGQVYFTSTSTGTATGSTYFWQFGDATTGYGDPIYHNYASNGVYNVTLTVTNPSSTVSTCSATVTNTVSVSTSPCSSTVNASFTYTNTSGTTYAFTSTSTGTTATSTYTWSFGDGNVSAVMNPTNTYTTNGNFLVNLYVADGACNDTASVWINITSLPCSLVPSFTYSNTSSGQVYFVSTSTGTSSGTSYSWNFGDATTGSGNPITHYYTTNGTYSVTLILSNSSFTTSSTCSATVTQTILVSTAPCTTAVNASFTYTNTGGGNVNFTSTSTGTTASSTYTWSFGDSNVSTVMNPSHTYGANGTYLVTFGVINGTCVDTASGYITISGLPCNIVPSFTFSNTSSGQLYFTSTSTGVGPGASYYWDFGDMTYGFTNPIYHTYASNGVYNVSLVVTNTPSSSACSATVTTPVTITTTSCVANPSFYLSKSTTVSNLWYAYPTYPANITNAFWDWGDATNSTGLYPSHTYASTGWYNICLTVTVSCVSTGSTCVLSNIYRVHANAGTEGIEQINVVNTAISVQELNKNNSGFHIYPNPNNGIFSLTLDPSYNNEASGIYVYNMLGAMIYSAKYEKNESLIKEVNLNDLPNGAYFIQLNTVKGNFSKKLMITK